MTDLFNFSNFPVLTTERLRLRRMTHDDAEAIMATFGSPEVLRFLNLDPVDTPEKAIGLIDWFEQEYHNHQTPNWGITLRGEDRLIGLWRESCWEHGRFVNIKQFGLLRSEFSST